MKSEATRRIPQDRISSLPDSILCHILSFLPTKFAAATSILSTRWRYILLSVPRIDLDDSLMLKPRKKQDEKRGRRAKLLPDFVVFVNRLLLLSRLTCLTEFRLKCQKPVRNIVFKTWISAVLLRDVQVLDIRVENLADDDGPFSLPCEILACKTLVVLKLYGKGVVLQFPKLVSLPNLKVLHLEDLHLVGNDGGWTFSSDFPLLEDLHLHRIDLYGIGFVDISLHSLTRLSWFCVSWSSLMLLHEPKVVIDTPNLENLEYHCCVTPNRSIRNLDSLVRADLYCYISPQATLSHFLGKMVNVKCLILIGNILKDLFKNLLEGKCSVPDFPNLTHLELNPSYDNDWKLMMTLLQHAPKLEKLICDMHDITETSEGLEFPAQEIVPQCLAQHLREVEVKSFSGREYEFEVVRYLLQHGAVLEVMSMYSSKDGISNRWPSLTCQKLLKFSRCSKKCEIVLN